MNLITPARDMSDTALNEFLAPFDAAQPPMDYSCHTAECAPDDDDGPADDLRSMDMLVRIMGTTIIVLVVAAALWWMS